MKDELCKAFCGALTVRDVPVGLAVGTVFRQSNGDAIGFYVAYEGGNKARARIEDDGQTLAALTVSGVDVASGPRAAVFAEMLADANARVDMDECVIHTDYMNIGDLPSAALAFVALLVRIQDLSALSKERVEETFKDDVLAAARERFAERAEILVDAPPTPDMAQFPADFIVRPASGVPLAVFVGTSEAKALEAYILWMQVQLVGLEISRVMLVLDTAKPQRIKERTLARVMNSFNLAVFPGQEVETLDAMERAVFGTVSVRGRSHDTPRMH
jgi:hypothetical protein